MAVVAAVAVINDKHKALAALTSAALALPGLQAQGATPAAQAEANFQYGHYQESDNRMAVDVYHADFTVPYKDTLELSFSIDRDTYSGATPAFSMPAAMANQLNYDDGVLSLVDIVSAASAGVSAATLTTPAGLNNFQAFKDVYDPGQAQILSTINALKDQAGLSIAPSPSNGTLNFDGMSQAAYGGHANIAATGICADCYAESGFVMGVVSDANPTNHLHQEQNDFAADGVTELYEVAYHNDSSGIYIRAQDGQAFDLKSMRFSAPWSTSSPFVNRRAGAWEILGFSQAQNLSLSSGDGTNYATRAAYKSVNNTSADSFNGIMVLGNDFKNIYAVWIHFIGEPDSFITAGSAYKMRLDDVSYSRLTGADAATIAQYNQQVSAINATQANLFQQLVIDAYRNVLNRMIPPMSSIVQKYQQQPLETRTMPTFSGKYYFDDNTLAFSGGMSEEPDFISNFGSVTLSHEFNNKLSTVSAGYNISSNQITRSTDAAHGAADEHTHGDNDNSPNYQALNETSASHGFNLGFSQILSKNTLFHSSASYTRQNGYLSNPYKYVYIRGEVTPEEYYQIYQGSNGAPINWNAITKLEMVGTELFREVRPDLRNQWSIANRINQYIPSLDASVHFDYRFYADDWGVNSHTAELKWYQSLPMGITVTPSFRYYSQSQAEFFAPYFLAPRADGHYSSDFRLADFGALSGGITFSKQFNKGVTLDAGFEYYTRQSGLKLGGGLDNSYADYSYYMVHGGLNVNLSALSSQSGEHAHHLHHNHGAPLPAGVMFGHMMNTPGELMVGYRYAYTNQTGGMQFGSGTVDDASLLNSACGNYQCASRPSEMSMNMHMLDIMYAPTDWLNLMLMPQIMDMKMSLSNIPGSTASNEHGSGHSSGGLGDTIMTAMFKAFDTSNHHLHVGLGVSAPTGSNEVTVDGQDSLTSQVQDYGMQLGSGTWDFRPSLTYTGQFADWSWGAQMSGIKRMQDRNRVGYALGDAFQSTAWGSYKVLNWLSTSLRGIYSEQGAIKGQFNRSHSLSSTVDHTGNYGGRFWDIGLGLNATLPDGPLAGHNFSIEWLQPIADDFNGHQLEREGTLNATWTFGF
ncbi:hypothetical protein A1353_15750 [Methylomonas methanica]|uniref:DUF3570 domain-containing protein n=2 Tax=Methylomonas methanica TaxID=421 RepID=A0A177MAF7_METMH|nr:DUF3570 domain-containing protein [Methylomonas methanica]OAI02696.1 hypothetical protein A1353_15750 [Methylomonas methanica]